MIEPKIHRATRVILATQRAIFRALIDPEAIVSWRPPKGMTARITAFDPKPGGTYTMELRYPPETASYAKSGDGVDRINGRFVELVADEKMVEEVRFDTSDPAFLGTMTITTALTPDRDGTRISIVAANVPPGISETDHRAGMESTLKNLANFLE